MDASQFRTLSHPCVPILPMILHAAHSQLYKPVNPPSLAPLSIYLFQSPASTHLPLHCGHFGPQFPLRLQTHRGGRPVHMELFHGETEDDCTDQGSSGRGLGTFLSESWRTHFVRLNHLSGRTATLPLTATLPAYRTRPTQEWMPR